MIVALLVSVCGSVAALVVLMHQTIAHLRAHNAQLYADNQALMTALAQANGQQLHFEAVNEKPSEPRRPAPPPYWKSKETADIQIGNKTVTVTKQLL